MALPCLALCFVSSNASSTPAPGDPANYSIMNFHAGVCRPANSTTKLTYAVNGVRNEDSTAAASVWCPIPIPDSNIPGYLLLPASPPLLLYGYVMDNDSVAGNDINCTLYQIENEGRTHWSWGNWKSSGASSTFQSLKLPNLDPSIEYDARLAMSYAASCTLPKKTSAAVRLISFHLRCDRNNCI